MDLKKLKSIFDKYSAKQKVPGSAIAFVEETETSFFCNGELEINKTWPHITENAVFEIGSVGKIFTALMVLILKNQGQLSLEMTLQELLPNVLISEVAKKIKLSQLLLHTSGLPRLPENLTDHMESETNPYINYNETHLLEYLQYADVPLKAGKFLYSNLGYGIIGYILEKQTGKSYAMLLDEMICQPLKLLNTSVPIRGKKIDNMATGHDPFNKPTPHWEFDVLQGAGSIVSTPTDMSIFIKEILFGKSPLQPALKESLIVQNSKMTFGAWHRPTFLMKYIGGICSYLWHNGMTGGFSTYIAVSIKRKRGMVLFYNRAAKQSVAALIIIPAMKNK